MAVSTRHLLDSLKPIVTFQKFDPSNITFANGPQVRRGLFICLFIYLFIFLFGQQLLDFAAGINLTSNADK